MKVDVAVETPVSRSVRARQLEGMFDVPASERCKLEWKADVPFDDGTPWNVGLIVGPSGCGKTTVARHMFGKQVDRRQTWGKPSVVDDFAKSYAMKDIAAVCKAVGFNTVPAWLRPYKVLSNGEQFRVNLARRLLEGGDLVVVDEFTSVVDRQVAKIASHAVQKHVRARKTQFVGVTCHYDVIPWLRPDWVFDPSTRRFERRRLRQRPKIDVTISPVDYAAWHKFSAFHYLTKTLNSAARCFCLFVGGQPVSFAGYLFRPHHGRGGPVMGCSRLVTLPDYQGIGLAFVLKEKVASWYTAVGRRVHHYPAHPMSIRSNDRSPIWRLIKKPGVYKPVDPRPKDKFGSNQGGRSCAIFAYAGPAGDPEEARRIFSYWPGHIE